MRVLSITRAHSYCPFAMALPTERTEAIPAGAFEFFGCPPRIVVSAEPLGPIEREREWMAVCFKGHRRTKDFRQLRSLQQSPSRVGRVGGGIPYVNSVPGSLTKRME